MKDGDVIIFLVVILLIFALVIDIAVNQEKTIILLLLNVRFLLLLMFVRIMVIVEQEIHTVQTKILANLTAAVVQAVVIARLAADQKQLISTVVYARNVITAEAKETGLALIKAQTRI